MVSLDDSGQSGASFVWPVALLLFGSGFCALIYQMAWLRALRLIFGASTAASAAVLAIFMGGLGLGGLVLGRKSEHSRNPLALYSNLELGVALAAAASLVLLLAVRGLYTAAGGTFALGIVGGSVVQLILATLVLGLPTFLMGGTLPATVRSVTATSDHGRRALGLLYALNTLGAVAGTVLTTFLLIEWLGIQKSVLVAALLNLLVALSARSLSRRPEMATAPGTTPDVPTDQSAVSSLLILVLPAAAVVGFVFFLMELVWYRMLAPILGGSTYTFGIILAVALLGIGAGGLLYGAGSRRTRPSGLLFAGTCALEALFIAVPFALGDGIALLALELRGLQALGFAGLAVGWCAVAAIVVLPAALVSGYQFPLLVALLGTGRPGVAREVGLTYSANTAGAILGSIAGGFGLVPMISAPGSWKLATVLLALTAWVFVGRHLLLSSRRLHAIAPATVAGTGLLLLLSPGPGAFWRHGGIGAGRVSGQIDGPNPMMAMRHMWEHRVTWETDGRESSVALLRTDDTALLVNGKSDGSARTDAPTTVLSVLVGALLHPDPRSGLVIGLGTGASAGWMAQVPTMEHVDVVELEPAVLEVAAACSAINEDVLTNPRVEMLIGDGRELLLTTDKGYDLVFSQPSNPYRAGVASLFTRDFYQAVAQRLNEGGLFLQWLQGYEVDAWVVRTAYATLGSVFEEVETWQVHSGDLLLVASLAPIRHDQPKLAERVQEEPYRSSLSRLWGVAGVEGLYSGYVASPELAKAIATTPGTPPNTDDHPLIEYGFARSVGKKGLFEVDDLRRLARSRQEHRPRVRQDAVDWSLVDELQSARAVMLGLDQPLPSAHTAEQKLRYQARAAYSSGDLRATQLLWAEQQEAPASPLDIRMVAESLAEICDPDLPEWASRAQAVEEAALLGRWHLRCGRPMEATAQLVESFRLYRDDPWPWPPMMARAVLLASELGRSDPALGEELFHALAEPFAMDLLQELRHRVRLRLAWQLDHERLCQEALEPYEPHIPWQEDFLRRRLDCYALLSHPLTAQAEADLRAYRARSAPPFWPPGG